MWMSEAGTIATEYETENQKSMRRTAVLGIPVHMFLEFNTDEKTGVYASNTTVQEDIAEKVNFPLHEGDQATVEDVLATPERAAMFFSNMFSILNEASAIKNSLPAIREQASKDALNETVEAVGRALNGESIEDSLERYVDEYDSKREQIEKQVTEETVSGALEAGGESEQEPETDPENASDEGGKQ
jgi:GTP cyclohydrolase I